MFGPAPSLAEAEKALQRKADGGITSDWEAAAASVNLGGSISHHRPRSKIVRDIAVLVDRLIAAGAKPRGTRGAPDGPLQLPARSRRRAAPRLVVTDPADAAAAAAGRDAGGRRPSPSPRPPAVEPDRDDDAGDIGPSPPTACSTCG